MSGVPFIATEYRTKLHDETEKKKQYYVSQFSRWKKKSYSSHLNCRTWALFVIGWVPIKLPSEINYPQHFLRPMPLPSNTTSQAVRSCLWFNSILVPGRMFFKVTTRDRSQQWVKTWYLSASLEVVFSLLSLLSTCVRKNYYISK